MSLGIRQQHDVNPLTTNLEAAGLMAVAMLLFTVNDTMVKELSTALPVGEILFLRGVLVTLCLAFVIRAQRLPLRRVLRPHPASILRGCLELGVTFCFISAIQVMPLADATALFFAAPIMLTGLAALILKERVGPRRWAAVVVGFIGVLVIVGPGGDWRPAALLALASAFFSAVRDVATRYIPPAEGSGTVALVTSAVVTAGGLLTLPLGWAPAGALHALMLAACALLIAAGYTCFVMAMRRGEVSFVAPVRYIALPAAGLAGFLAFGAVPAPRMFAGAAIIAGSGLFIFFRERALARQGKA
jgi:drug/metabolite transporter (DMT)-like permease